MDFKDYKKDQLFYCYSMSLFHFLKLNEFFYLYKDRNPSSNKYYWVFERTPEFYKALTAYMQNKKK